MKSLSYIDHLHVDGAFDAPKTMRDLFRQLGIKPDNTGLAGFKDDRIQPRSSEDGLFIYKFDSIDGRSFTVKEFCSQQREDLGPTDRIQAARFLIQYLRNLEITGYFLLPFSLWIPFLDEKGNGAFRVFARRDGSLELFLYPVEDPSTWNVEDTYITLATWRF